MTWFPFKNSNKASLSCLKCKNLENQTKVYVRESVDKNLYVNVLIQPHNSQENVQNDFTNNHDNQT